MTKIYLTEYHQNGRLYGGRVEAESWEDAEKSIPRPQPGEKVIGVLTHEDRGKK